MGSIEPALELLPDTSKPQADLRRYDVLHSPFLELQTPFTVWEAVKMAFLIVTVIPRCLLALVPLVLLAIISAAASFNWPQDVPLSGTRRRAVKFGASLTGLLLWLLGFVVQVKGYENFEEAEKEGGVIGLFNHSSYIDAVLVMYLFAPSGVSKESNARLPLIGTCIKAFQNIYVSEGKAAAGGDWTGAPRMNLAKMIADRARDKRYNSLLFMAPEGTCGDNRCVLQFKTGAFVAGCPVLPVCLKYNLAAHNPSWTIICEPWHFLRLLCQTNNIVQVLILPIYRPSPEERANPALFAANVRELFASKLNLPLVEQSHREYRALYKAGVRVTLGGRRVVAPPGVLDASGQYADLTVTTRPKDA